MLADSNVIKALCVLVGNAHLSDLWLPPKCTLGVEKIYLMIQPANTRAIKIEDVLPWLNPSLFLALQSFTTFQEYVVNSEIVLQLPFINGPATFKTQNVKDNDEFWAIVSSATGFSNFNY